MNQEPINQPNTELEPQEILFSTAIEMLDSRRKTTTHGNRYQATLDGRKRQLEIGLCTGSKDVIEAQEGILSEALCYIVLTDLGIPITISTGDDDMNGIDFYIMDKPVDVTSNTNPEKLSNKLMRDSSTILCTPRFQNQKMLQLGRTYPKVLDEYLKGTFDSTQYCKALISINAHFKQILIQNLDTRHKPKEVMYLKGVKKKHIYQLENTLHRISSCL